MTISSLLVKPVNSVKVAVVASLFGLTSISGVVSAASQCKGLDNATCDQNAACGWVESYQRSDGRDVKAFCRTSSKGKARKVSESSGEKDSSKKADTNAS